MKKKNPPPIAVKESGKAPAAALEQTIKGSSEAAAKDRTGHRLPSSVPVNPLPLPVCLLPIVLFGPVSLLTVRLYIYYAPMSQFFWSAVNDDTQLNDTFSHGKMVCVVVAAVLALALTAVDYVRNRMAIAAAFRCRRAEKKGPDPAYVLMAVYCLFVLLSLLFSEYRHFALFGFIDRFEGTITILSYMVMLLYIARTCRSRKAAKWVLIGAGAAVFAACIWGFFQSVGKDPFNTVLFQKLITPNRLLDDGRTAWQAIEELAAEGKTAFSFAFEQSMVYQTLFNPNYVPFYLCLVLPVAVFALCFCWNREEKGGKKAAKVLFLLLFYALALYNFFCADSASGYVGLAVMVLAALLLLRRKLLLLVKPLLSVVLATALVMGITADHWYPETRSVLEKTAGKLVSCLAMPVYAEELKFENPAGVRSAHIDYMETGFDYVELSINGEPLRIVLTQDMSFAFVDGNGDTVTIEPIEDNYYCFYDLRFHDYVKIKFFNSEDGKNLYVRLHNNAWWYKTDWDFRFDLKKGGVYFQVGNGKETPLQKAEAWGFEGHYDFGSARGYIWSRSLPLLKNSLLWGSGADTFAMVFPQSDYGARYNYFYDFDIVVDKPHNLYLGMAINTGCASLATWLGLVGLALLRILRRRPSCLSFTGCMQWGLSLGILGFLAVAVFNDSSLSTMPAFYTALGLLMAQCATLAETPKEKENVQNAEK